MQIESFSANAAKAMTGRATLQPRQMPKGRASMLLTGWSLQRTKKLICVTLVPVIQKHYRPYLPDVPPLSSKMGKKIPLNVFIFPNVTRDS